MIPNFLDLSSVGPPSAKAIRKRWRLADDEVVVGNISNLRPVKGLEYFLQSAALVFKKRPAKFVIVGSGRLEVKLQKLACDLGINQAVLFTGSIANPEEIIPAFDVLASSSLSEGFGMTILEGWAFGKPVVCTRCGGPENIIDNGRNGFLVPVKNPRVMAQKIITLLDRPQLAIALGRAGKRKLEKNYTVKQCVKKYEAVYRKLYEQG